MTSLFAEKNRKAFWVITILVLVISFIPFESVSAFSATGIAENISEWAATILLQIVGAITYLSGTILNFTIKFSIVDMKANVAAAGIDNAWGVIRDVSNMGFIFILLYAAIMTIIGQGQDNRKLIVNVVVAAVLINFSLFITKLFIDATNLLAMLFYGAMVPASALGTEFTNTGLANSLMEPLRIQSIWAGASGDGVTATQILLVGILGSVVALIAAFVFFAIAIMFVIRFVVLLFTMVLSPLAFLALVLPQAKKYRDQWWEALSGQAFFAPIYFLLTWIVISIAQSLAHNPAINPDAGNLATAIGGTAASTVVDGVTTLSTKASPESIGILLNFGLIIALLIASLVIAKEWANKAGPGVTGLTKWATGLAGGATMGLAGFAGRRTLGAAGSALGDSERLKAAATKSGPAGAAARLALMASRKTAGASFDFRGTGLGGTLEAGKAQKGGYTEDLKKAAEKKKKFGEALTPSDIAVDEAEQALKNAKTPAERFVARRKLDELKGVSEDDARKRMVDTLRKRGWDETRINNYLNTPEGRDAVKGRVVKGEGTKRKEVYAEKLRDPRWTKFWGINRNLFITESSKQAAAELRKGKKSARQLFDEAVAAAGGTPPSPPGTPPAAGGGPAPGGTPGGAPGGGGPTPGP